MGLSAVTFNSKRKDLSANEKLNILKQYDQLPKMSQRNAALQLKISQPLLCRILKNRNSIENSIRQNANTIRKRNRRGKDLQIEEALKMWFEDLRKRNIPISGNMLRGKASEIAKELGKNFVATDGWFNRWKKRENIVYDKYSLFPFKKKKTECHKNIKTPSKTPELLQMLDQVDDKISQKKNFRDEKLDNCDLQSIGKLNYSCQNFENSVSQDILKVFIKTEESSNEDLIKPLNNTPTNEKMLEALKILECWVKHRTQDFEFHYKYEQSIKNLLAKN